MPPLVLGFIAAAADGLLKKQRFGRREFGLRNQTGMEYYDSDERRHRLLHRNRCIFCYF